jgi:hypothetical protein
MPLSDKESELRHHARVAIARGTLPCEESDHIYGRRGSGEPCALCHEVIPTDVIAYWTPVQGRILQFHIQCYKAWQLECARAIDLKKGPIP